MPLISCCVPSSLLSLSAVLCRSIMSTCLLPPLLPALPCPPVSCACCLCVMSPCLLLAYRYPLTYRVTCSARVMSCCICVASAVSICSRPKLCCRSAPVLRDRGYVVCYPSGGSPFSWLLGWCGQAYLLMSNCPCLPRFWDMSSGPNGLPGPLTNQSHLAPHGCPPRSLPGSPRRVPRSSPGRSVRLASRRR